MKFLNLLFLSFITFFSLEGKARVLPPIFYDSPESQEQLCSSKKNHPEFWFDLMSVHIDNLLNSHELNDFDQDVFKNQLVTLSYLELSRGSVDEERSMTYVYANASHHLGRLIRFHYWERFPNETLGQKDRSYISGDILNTTVRTVPRFLSKTLMTHSLFLYKTLSWSLGASIICGQERVTTMLKTHMSQDTLKKIFPNLPTNKQKELVLRLKKAFAEKTLEQFVVSFVAFEQAYLQYTMYKDPAVRLPSSLGVLDKMRFIPFNGEKKLSYYEWCKTRKCRKASLNLELRILFDQTVILEELSSLKNDPLIFEERMHQTALEEVSDFILNNLIPGGIKGNFTTTRILDASNIIN